MSKSWLRHCLGLWEGIRAMFLLFGLVNEMVFWEMGAVMFSVLYTLFGLVNEMVFWEMGQGEVIYGVLYILFGLVNELYSGRWGK